MIALFLHNLTKVWFRHVWPEIRVPLGERAEEAERLDIDRFTPLHPQLMTLKELGQTIANLTQFCDKYIQKLLTLRRERPVAFSSSICFILSCTAYIGNTIDGCTLLFWILLASVTTPGIYLYLLPNNVKFYIKQSISQSIRHNQNTESSSGISLETKPLEESVPYYTKFLRETARYWSMTFRYLGMQETYINQEVSSEIPEEKEAMRSRNLSWGHSDDLESDKSTSIIDSDEEDKDGFVIL